METIHEKLNHFNPENRLAIFNALAQALNYPTQELAVSLKNGDYLRQLSNALQTKESNRLGEQLTKHLKGYAEISQSAEDIQLALEKEYTWMCFASKPRLLYLFGSVYREGKLLQESTFDIARLYYEAGLKIDENFQLPPDHIAIEMEFMAYLCFNELNAQQDGDKEKEQYAGKLQKTVLENHLAAFAGQFAEKLACSAKSDFYKIIAWFITALFKDMDDHEE
jgi:TorA maturation chaperone TorD